jgi:hypothetical protein
MEERGRARSSRDGSCNDQSLLSFELLSTQATVNCWDILNCMSSVKLQQPRQVDALVNSCRLSALDSTNRRGAIVPKIRMLREWTRAAEFYIHLVRVNLVWVNGATKRERNDSFLKLTTCSHRRRNSYLHVLSLSFYPLWEIQPR